MTAPPPVPVTTAGRLANTTGTALFNAEKMIVNLGDDPDIARELLPGGLDDIETHARALLEALNSKDIATALRHVHTVKGLAGTLGAAASQSIAIAIEKQLKVENIADAQLEQADLTTSLTNLRQAAEAWLQKT
jgi:HPt (histidine-containing phosphotransfer) domain-containing protein